MGKQSHISRPYDCTSRDWACSPALKRSALSSIVIILQQYLQLRPFLITQRWQQQWSQTNTHCQLRFPLRGSCSATPLRSPAVILPPPVARGSQPPLEEPGSCMTAVTWCTCAIPPCPKRLQRTWLTSPTSSRGSTTGPRPRLPPAKEKPLANWKKSKTRPMTNSRWTCEQWILLCPTKRLWASKWGLWGWMAEKVSYSSRPQKFFLIIRFSWSGVGTSFSKCLKLLFRDLNLFQFKF